MALSEIVQVNIQAGTAQPTRKGFGIPLLMAYHTVWAGAEVRTYHAPSEVLADGFAATSMPYLWAAEAWSQNPTLETIKIGRLPVPTGIKHTQVIDATDLIAGTNIIGSVQSPNGTVTPISITWTTDLATTLGLLRTALQAISGIATCTLASPLLTVPASNAGEMVHLSFSTAGVDVRDTTADWGYTAALDAAAAIDPNFYAVAADCNSPKNMDKIARWALANGRFAFFGPQYTKPSQFAAGEFTTGGDYTALEANKHAAGLFTRQPRTACPEAGWLGLMLPQDPGSAAWFYKTIAGFGVDPWTSTQRATIEAYNGNHYTNESGLSITRPGKSFGGEWIDVTLGLDWLTNDLQARIFAALANNPKIPYTDQGLAILVGEVRASLKEAERRGIVASGWGVTVTPAASQTSADRAARKVSGLNFSATLAGAVYKTTINGTVST